MTQPAAAPPPTSVDAASTWATWLAIGATGFGGPAAQIALLHREVVERRRWLDEEDFLAAMRVCMLLPGPEAQQLATYAGWRIGGWRTGLVAGGLFLLPGALLVTALAWIHAVGETVPLVAAAFAGTRPAVLALVWLAAWRIGRRSVTTPLSAAIVLAALGALAAGAPFPLVMLAAAAIGLLTPLPPAPPARPPEEAAGARGAAAADPPGAAPREVAAGGVRQGTARTALAVLTVAAGLWSAAYAGLGSLPLAAARGREIARLFTETTLLSFGGAYAVVPWALDAAVARGWIEPTERCDALAMGEATPGPLILVVTFLGFLAGYRQESAGSGMAGLCGAAVATWFAFLPSFALILTVAPFVRRVRSSPRTARALAAVGGVVVAAIALFGMRLAGDALLGHDGRPDAVAMLTASAAALALARGWASAPVVVTLAALVGAIRAIVAAA